MLDGNAAGADKLIRVLIAEDNTFVRSLMRHRLDMMKDITVAGEAANGVDAILHASVLKPDVVLMDVNMPVVDGVEATRSIKRKHPDIRVIIVTGLDNKEVVKSAFEAGADGYFLKFNTFDKLPDCIQCVVSGACWLDPALSSTVLRNFLHSIVSDFDIEDELAAGAQNDSTIGEIPLLLQKMRTAISRADYDLAIDNGRLSYALSRSYFGPDSLVALSMSLRLADLYYLEEDFDAAEQILLLALQRKESLVDDADDETDCVINFLGKISEQAGDLERAYRYYSWSLRHRERSGDAVRIREARERLRHLSLPG